MDDGLKVHRFLSKCLLGIKFCWRSGVVARANLHEQGLPFQHYIWIYMYRNLNPNVGVERKLLVQVVKEKG